MTVYALHCADSILADASHIIAIAAANKMNITLM